MGIRFKGKGSFHEEIVVHSMKRSPYCVMYSLLVKMMGMPPINAGCCLKKLLLS